MTLFRSETLYEPGHLNVRPKSMQAEPFKNPKPIVTSEDCILRLVENMTLGRNAVGYLTESMHGAGSPQAQRIQIARQMHLDLKEQLAKELAGIEKRDREKLSTEIAGYFGKVFDTEV